jgi:hypothetical protein
VLPPQFRPDQTAPHHATFYPGATRGRRRCRESPECHRCRRTLPRHHSSPPCHHLSPLASSNPRKAARCNRHLSLVLSPLDALHLGHCAPAGRHATVSALGAVTAPCAGVPGTRRGPHSPPSRAGRARPHAEKWPDIVPGFFFFQEFYFLS